jgi:hypothetical protein
MTSALKSNFPSTYRDIQRANLFTQVKSRSADKTSESCLIDRRNYEKIISIINAI